MSQSVTGEGGGTWIKRSCGQKGSLRFVSGSMWYRMSPVRGSNQWLMSFPASNRIGYARMPRFVCEGERSEGVSEGVSEGELRGGAP